MARKTLPESDVKSMFITLQRLVELRADDSAMSVEKNKAMDHAIERIFSQLHTARFDGYEPVVDLVEYVVSQPLSDETPKQIHVIGLYFQGERRESWSAFERSLPSSLLSTFTFGYEFDIPISEWMQTAQAAVDFVRFMIRTREVQGPDYLKEQDRYFGVFQIDKERLFKHPKYGPRLLAREGP